MTRHALLIGISEFRDQRLNRLNAPSNDVIALRRILLDPDRGAFDTVEISVNEDYQAVRDRVAILYNHDRAPDDSLLLYYSGHGILDRGRLFLATSGSDLDKPRGRSLAAKDVREFMEDCRAGRHVVVLDCCHSGAFVEGAKAGGAAPAVTEKTFAGDGAGTYVLTASDAMQFAWDGGELRSGDGSGTSSFTSWLVEGLEDGKAAPDEDQITIDALYRYVCDRARSNGSRSTPQRFVHGGVGDPVISRNPLAGSGRISQEIREKLSAGDYGTRLAIVAELKIDLRGADKLHVRAVSRFLEGYLKNGKESDYRVRQLIEEVLEEARRRLASATDANPRASAEAIDVKAERPNPAAQAAAQDRREDRWSTDPDPGPPEKATQGDPIRPSPRPARHFSKPAFRWAVWALVALDVIILIGGGGGGWFLILIISLILVAFLEIPRRFEVRRRSG